MPDSQPAVSRVEDVLRGRAIRTGHFNEGPAYRLDRPTGSRDWLLILTLSGSGIVTTRSFDKRLSPGDLMTVAPETPIAYRTDPEAGRWQLLWAHLRPGLINPRWLTLGPDTAPGLQILPLPRDRIRRQVQRGLESAYRYTEGPLPRAAELAGNAVERALIWASMEAGPQPASTIDDDRVLAAREFIHQRFDQPLSVEAVAHAAGLSVSRCAERFKAATGSTIRAYIEEQRLSHAAEWLRLTPWPVQAIANRAGFDNPFYFSNRFRKRYGASPRAWRKRKADTSQEH